MLKDQIKNYRNFGDFKSCARCKVNNHLIGECPKIFYVPDKDFLIKKFIFSKPQTRKKFNRKIRKDMNALTEKFIVNCSALKCGFEDDEDNDASPLEIKDEIPKNFVRNRKKTIFFEDSKKMRIMNNDLEQEKNFLMEEADLEIFDNENVFKFKKILK